MSHRFVTFLVQFDYLIMKLIDNILVELTIARMQDNPKKNTSLYLPTVKENNVVYNCCVEMI